MSASPSVAPPGATVPGSPAGAIALLAGIFLLPVLVSLRPVSDWDIWWHLRVGQWIVENFQVTTNDPFSTYGADRPWLAYSWLFEVLIWRLYEWLGLTGILVYRVLMALAVIVAFHRIALRSDPRFAVSTLFTTVAAVSIFPLISERPWLFTILFTTLTLEVVLDLRQGEQRWTFWALPLVYVLWAQIHIQFVYGFVVLGIGVVAPLLDRRSVPYLRRLIVLSFACALATLINPYGLHLYGVVLEYATQATPFNVVDELMAPDFRTLLDWLVLALAILTAFALGRRKELSSFDVLLCVAAVVLCFRARRDVWMVVLAALVILPALVPSSPSAFAVNRRVGLCAAVLVLPVGVLLGRGRGLTEEHLHEAVAKKFPARATAFVAEKQYEGPLFNYLDMGGYLIWKLPRLPVSMDGRTNLHGEERIKRSLSTWAGGKDWEKDPELNEANLVLAPPGTALTSLLRRDGRFRIDYEDDQAVVFVRKR